MNHLRTTGFGAPHRHRGELDDMNMIEFTPKAFTPPKCGKCDTDYIEYDVQITNYQAKIYDILGICRKCNKKQRIGLMNENVLGAIKAMSNSV